MGLIGVNLCDGYDQVCDTALVLFCITMIIMYELHICLLRQIIKLYCIVQ